MFTLSYINKHTSQSDAWELLQSCTTQNVTYDSQHDVWQVHQSCHPSLLMYPLSPKTSHYGVPTISGLLQIIGLFCQRELSKRRYSAKETYCFIDPTDCSHPILDILYTMTVLCEHDWGVELSKTQKQWRQRRTLMVWVRGGWRKMRGRGRTGSGGKGNSIVCSVYIYIYEYIYIHIYVYRYIYIYV